MWDTHSNMEKLEETWSNEVTNWKLPWCGQLTDVDEIASETDTSERISCTPDLMQEDTS